MSHRRARAAVALVAVTGLALGVASCAGGSTGVGVPPARHGTTGGGVAAGGPTVSAPPVDVVVGEQLWLVTGARINLGFAGELPSVHRVDRGWLVTAANGTWLVTPDGGHHRVLGPGRWPVVSADGHRIAYRDGDRILVTTLAGSTLVTVAATGHVGAFRPDRFLGDELLLSYSESGGSIDGYDYWDPTKGPYHASPHSPADIEIVAATSAGLLAVVSSAAESCLALLSHSFARLRTGCLPGLMSWSAAPVSPDGRWMIGVLTSTGIDISKAKRVGNPPALVDLAAFFDHPGIAGQWPDDPVHPIDLSRCVWRGSTAVICPTRGGLATLAVGDPGAVALTMLAGVPIEPLTTSPYAAVPVPDIVA